MVFFFIKIGHISLSELDEICISLGIVNSCREVEEILKLIGQTESFLKNGYIVVLKMITFNDKVGNEGNEASLRRFRLTRSCAIVWPIFYTPGHWH